MKKLMIFGGSGFVGGNLAKAAQQKGWEVYIVDSFYRAGVDSAQWKVADITDKASVDGVMDEMKPDAVVNVAAIADIDKADMDRELAWKVNVDGAKYIAESCASRNIKLVFFSSDAVFDGKGRDYTECDKPDPVNYYGKTKMEAEKAVLLAHAGAVVIRISLIVGFPVTGGNFFLAGLENKLRAGNEIYCPGNEVRTPIDVLTLCECVLELAEGSYSGILHLGSRNSIDRYELTRKFAGLMGFDEKLVKLQLAKGNETGRVPRHKNGIINVAKAQEILKTKLLNVDESILRAIKTRR